MLALAGKITLGLLVLLVLTVAGLYLRLAIGDVSGDWLKQAVDRRIEQSKPPGLVVSYESLSIGLTAGGAPRALLSELFVHTPNDQVDLTAQTATIVFDPGALLFGGLRIDRVDLIGGSLDVLLPYMENGPLKRPIPFGVAFVDTGLQIVRDAVDGKLGTVNLADIRVSFSRPEWPRPVIYYTTNASMVWDRDDFSFDGSFVGTDGAWSVNLTRQKPVAGKRRRMDLTVRDVAPRDLAGNPRLVADGAQAEDGVEVGGFPISVDMLAWFDPDAQVAEVELDAQAGAGRIGPRSQPVAILDEIDFELGWRRGQEELAVEELSIHAGRTTVTATGSFRPPWFTPDGKRGELVLRAEAPVFAFHTDDAPVETVGIQAHSFIDLEAGEFVLTRADLVTDDAALAARGRAYLGGKFPEISFASKLRDVDYEKALALWPPPFGGAAREWVETHVRGGRIKSAELAFRLGEGFFDGDETTPAWNEEDMQGSFEISNIDLMVVDTLPVVAGLDGGGAISGGRMELVVNPLSARLESGRDVEITAGGVRFEDLRQSDGPIVVAVNVAADSAAVAEIVDGFAPDALPQAGIEPSALSGDATVASFFVFNPETAESEGPVAFSAIGEVKGLAASEPIQGRTISDGDLQFDVNEERAKVVGTVSFDGLPAEIDIDKTLVELQGGVASGVAFTLDRATRERIGLDLGEALTGSVEVRLVGGSPEEGQLFEVDLANAEIALPMLGLSKSKGAKGLVTFRMTETGGTKQIDDLTFTTDRQIAAASAVLDDEGLKSADVSALTLSPDDKLSVTVNRAGDGYKLAMTGEQADLRPLLASLKQQRNSPGEGAESEFPAIELTAKIGRALGHNKIVARSVDLSTRVLSGKLFSARLTAQVGGSSVDFTWAPDGDWRNLQLQASNLGALLRFTDAYDRLTGGRTIVQGRLPVPGNSQAGAGTMAVREFVLEDENRINQVEARIRDSAARSRGLRDNSSSLTDGRSGLVFEKLSGRFSQEDSILTVSDLALQGQSLGAIAGGAIDLKNRRIDFRGTFIPLYGLNNLFGRVPVLGQILGGGSRGGLLGLTFRYFGPISEPELSINPASLLTPGIFRKVFGFEPFSN